jgi:hypothetical protein
MQLQYLNFHIFQTTSSLYEPLIFDWTKVATLMKCILHGILGLKKMKICITGMIISLNLFFLGFSLL